MKRSLWTLAVAMFVCIATVPAARPQGQPPRKPNILIIVADDMGYADIGVHGSKDIPTPNIDRLARMGTRFTDAYVTGPHCSPTRAALLTGRYQQRFGHEVNVPGPAQAPDAGLPVTETTMADRLHAAGYRTALFGKWHLGFADRFHPMARGFDEFYGFLGGAHSYFESLKGMPNSLLDGRRPVDAEGYLTEVLTNRAVDFIKRQRDQPFLLYLAYNAVHVPLEAPEKYLTRFPHISDPTRRTYAAMLSAMDDGIGRMLDAIRSQNLDNDTLIFFFSDNGGPTMESTGVNGSSNAPLRGSKRQTWEGGIRVPFVIRWKGHLPEGKIDSRPIIQLDVLPTALAAAGVTIKPEWRLDGVDLLPFVRGTVRGAPHDALYWRLFRHMAIRKGDWNLVRTMDGPLVVADPPTRADLADAQLFNLSEDIGERNNLASKHPGKVKELLDAWLRWNSELARPLWRPGGA